ncbi:MAG: SdiA-regulated domain-containing protein [Candidatus Aminicenantes bacterium]|nr:SdiA-regulated domain-containing protein [Candidatus Aminicenantes bacterium]
MKIKLFLMGALILLASCSPAKNSPTIRFPVDWLGIPGYGINIDQQRFVEPSGICFHPLRKTLFIVSDEGEIAEIKTDGTPVFNLKIPGDLEGITVNPQSGLLYIVKEGDDIILEFDPDEREVKRIFPINREFQGNANFLQKQKGYDQGIESIAFVSDKDHPEGGTFYAGNQWDPPCIIEILVPLRSSRTETAEARIIRVLPFKMDDPAGMYYDSKTGHLNVVSDAYNILVEITLEGKLVREYAFLGDNQEGIAKDDEGYLYIAQGEGGIIKVKDLR